MQEVSINNTRCTVKNEVRNKLLENQSKRCQRPLGTLPLTGLDGAEVAGGDDVKGSKFRNCRDR